MDPRPAVSVAVTATEPPSAPAAAEATQAPQTDPSGGLVRWQLRLLPFMVGGLSILALTFFVVTLWNYAALSAGMKVPEANIRAELSQLRQSGTQVKNIEFEALLLLEERSMRYRYGISAAAMQGRMWTRFMAFMVGMMMVFSGCIFILGKLDTDFSARGRTAGIEATFKTTSPGLILTCLGTLLMYAAISVVTTVDYVDRPVFIKSSVASDAQESLAKEPEIP